jgi:hypothetical protein
MRVVRPRGSPPLVILSRPDMPVGVFCISTWFIFERTDAISPPGRRDDESSLINYKEQGIHQKRATVAALTRFRTPPPTVPGSRGSPEG